jgi:hypothetical protein
MFSRTTRRPNNHTLSAELNDSFYEVEVDHSNPHQIRHSQSFSSTTAVSPPTASTPLPPIIHPQSNTHNNRPSLSSSSPHTESKTAFEGITSEDVEDIESKYGMAAFLQITEMGIKPPHAYLALRHSKGNVSEAISLCLELDEETMETLVRQFNSDRADRSRKNPADTSPSLSSAGGSTPHPSTADSTSGRSGTPAGRKPTLFGKIFGGNEKKRQSNPSPLSIPSHPHTPHSTSDSDSVVGSRPVSIVPPQNPHYVGDSFLSPTECFEVDLAAALSASEPAGDINANPQVTGHSRDSSRNKARPTLSRPPSMMIMPSSGSSSRSGSSTKLRQRSLLAPPPPPPPPSTGSSPAVAPLPVLQPIDQSPQIRSSIQTQKANGEDGTTKVGGIRFSSNPRAARSNPVSASSSVRSSPHQTVPHIPPPPPPPPPKKKGSNQELTKIPSNEPDLTGSLKGEPVLKPLERKPSSSSTPKSMNQFSSFDEFHHNNNEQSSYQYKQPSRYSKSRSTSDSNSHYFVAAPTTINLDLNSFYSPPNPGDLEEHPVRERYYYRSPSHAQQSTTATVPATIESTTSPILPSSSADLEDFVNELSKHVDDNPMEHYQTLQDQWYNHNTTADNTSSYEKKVSFDTRNNSASASSSASTDPVVPRSSETVFPQKEASRSSFRKDHISPEIVNTSSIDYTEIPESTSTLKEEISLIPTATSEILLDHTISPVVAVSSSYLDEQRHNDNENSEMILSQQSVDEIQDIEPLLLRRYSAMKDEDQVEEIEEDATNKSNSPRKRSFTQAEFNEITNGPKLEPWNLQTVSKELDLPVLASFSNPDDDTTIDGGYSGEGEKFHSSVSLIPDLEASYPAKEEAVEQLELSEEGTKESSETEGEIGKIKADEIEYGDEEIKGNNSDYEEMVDEPDFPISKPTPFRVVSDHIEEASNPNDYAHLLENVHMKQAFRSVLDEAVVPHKKSDEEESSNLHFREMKEGEEDDRFLRYLKKSSSNDDNPSLHPTADISTATSTANSLGNVPETPEYYENRLTASLNSIPCDAFDFSATFASPSSNAIISPSAPSAPRPPPPPPVTQYPTPFPPPPSATAVSSSSPPPPPLQQSSSSPPLVDLVRSSSITSSASTVDIPETPPPLASSPFIRIPNVTSPPAIQLQNTPPSHPVATTSSSSSSSSAGIAATDHGSSSSITASASLVLVPFKRRKYLTYRVIQHNDGKWLGIISLKQTQLKRNEPSPQGNRPETITLGPCQTREICVDLCESMAPPTWSGKDDCKECTVCATRFTMFNKGHHCRNCGFLVCTSCSDKIWPSIMIPPTYHNEEKIVRVCHTCHYLTELFVAALRDGDETMVRTIYASGNINIYNPFACYANSAYAVSDLFHSLSFVYTFPYLPCFVSL